MAALARLLAVLGIGYLLSRASSSAASSSSPAAPAPDPRTPKPLPRDPVVVQAPAEPLPGDVKALLELAGALPRDVSSAEAPLLPDSYPAAAGILKITGAGWPYVGAVMALTRTESVYASPWGDDDGWSQADIAACLWLTGWQEDGLDVDALKSAYAGAAYQRFDNVADRGLLTVRELSPEAVELGPWGLTLHDCQAAAELLTSQKLPSATVWGKPYEATPGAQAYAGELVFTAFQSAREASVYGSPDAGMPASPQILGAWLWWACGDPVICSQLTMALILGYGVQRARQVWGLSPMLYECGGGSVQLAGVLYT